eukprot:Ihof_evm1s217 gene=Ihof_evmTU1s217
MPALKLFNRRWRIASDDFFLPGFIVLNLRMAWSAILVGTIFYSHRLGSSLINDNIYLWGSLSICIISSTFSVVLIRISTRGLILQTSKRRTINPVLYLCVALEGWEAVWTLWGTFVVVDMQGLRKDLLFRILLYVTVALPYIFLLSLVITAGCIFDPFSHAQHGSNLGVKEAWERIFRTVFCCVKSKVSPYEDIADLFAQIFTDMDFVPSDIFAGLVLLRDQHKVRYADRNSDAHYTTGPSRPLNPNDNSECITLLRVHHFSKYIVASYGWPMYILSHLWCGLCNLGCNSDYWRNRLPSNVHNGSCFDCNYAATKKAANLNDDDIIYYNGHNDVYESPYYVALDHHQQAVVICIRGSLSLNDALTDMTATCSPVPWIEGGYAHGGMLKGAQYLLAELRSTALLSKAFTNHPNYQLVVVGHSLGAGIATLVSIYLKEDYPTLQCYAYSPPGGLVSKRLADHCCSYVMSVVVGCDVVPRASIPTVVRLRDEMVSCLEKCPKAKYKVLGHGIRNIMVDALDYAVGSQEIVSHSLLDTDPEDPEHGSSSESPLLLDSSKEDRATTSLDQCVVKYMAGKVLHIIKDHTATKAGASLFSIKKKRFYKACWAPLDNFD